MDVFDRESAYFFHTYKRIPLEIDRGEGVYLYTKDGRRYLDLFGGLAVNALGYAHPGVLEAIAGQARRYIHLSNYFLQEPQLALAELLVRHSGYSKVFFSNSGTEAIEGGMKIARKWGTAHGKTDIIGFSNGFHGRTMGALSLMDRPPYRDGYGPFLPNCSVAEFNNVEGLRRAVSRKTAALLLESIQGEGGIQPVTKAFADELMRLKAEFGFLLIADEIQAGLGRTGKLFGFEHLSLTPDIVVVAKPIGGGLPLGAILGAASVADVLTPGVHGTTFGGNPVACAAGIVVMKELYEGKLMANAAAMGGLLQSKLRALQGEFPHLVKEVRGYGLMVGMDLTREGETIVKRLRELGVLLNCTAQTVLRFLPPLIIREAQLEEGVAAIRTVFRELS